MDWFENIKDSEFQHFFEMIYFMDYDKIKLRRLSCYDDEIIEVEGTDKNNKSKKHYYSAFGEVFETKMGYILKRPINLNNQIDLAFINLMLENNDPNLYLADLKIAQEMAIQEDKLKEFLEIQQQINKLTHQQAQLEEKANRKLRELNIFINTKKNIEKHESLLVKKFLSNMSKEERQTWLEENGFAENNEETETNTISVD